jgi:cobalt-zinc-cadmium efflux system outer membrane protein
MDHCVSTRPSRVVRVAALAFVGAVSPLLAFSRAEAADLPRAPQLLAAAVQEAWGRHPQAAATRATLEAAAARAEAASQPLYNPELEVNADDEGPDRSATGSLGLTLDLSGKRRARSAVGRADLDAATASALLQRRDFAQSWLEAWAALRAADRKVALGNERVDLLARAGDLAVRQFKAGDISVLDRDLALLARDEAAAEQAALLIDLATASASFQTLARGASTPAAMDLADVSPATTAVDIEALPEWTIAESKAASAKAQVTVAERERIADPTVSLRAGSIELADGVRDELYGLTITVPLFVRNSFRAELVAAKADARAAAADADRLRYELQARAERASASYRAIRSAWEQWRKSPATDVQTRADLLERLWRAGEMSTSDYLLQLQQTLDTALAGADLEGRAWASLTDYLVATGQLDAWLGLAATTGE